MAAEKKPAVKIKSTKKPKTAIGWAEWCALPDLELPAIKAKIDTGAKTSALHAYDIRRFSKDGADYVRFKIHPVQGNNKIEVECEAPLVERRPVTSSNGEREKRYVIKTRLHLDGRHMDIELTLTSRHKMEFRMLLGREALRKGRFLINPGKTYLLGKSSDSSEFYKARAI